MSVNKHTVTPTEVSILGYENYTDKDLKVLEAYKVNKLFNPDIDQVQLHIYSLGQELLYSDYGYKGHRQLLNSSSANKAGASSLFVDPAADAVEYGFDKGDVNLLYIFYKNIFGRKNNKAFYIEDISPDRTELKLNSIKVPSSTVIDLITKYKQDLSEGIVEELRIDLGSNDLFIVVNLDILPDNSVAIKLYEPLPTQYTAKDLLDVIELVADSVQYSISTEVTLDRPKTKKLREANFNLEILEESIQPSEYFTFDELFSLPTNSTNYQAIALANKENVELTVDYTDFSDFVHFSSAVERLKNFKYKLDLIQQYEGFIATLQASSTVATVAGKNVEYYEKLIKGIIGNFDGYERYLFFENNVNAWPKTGSTKPYINQASTTSASIAFYNSQLEEADTFDIGNYNSLRNTIPAFIKDDASNEKYTLFIDMIAQHFDNLWLYAKEVTKKYDGDNRPDAGIPVELVETALKNFGVKLYTSNLSLENLLAYFSGETYNQGDEVINNYEVATTGITGELQPMPYKNYQQEVYKRLYHNLPHLLKTKGTPRGLKALMNCFGIPPEILTIKEFGGIEENAGYYVGYDKAITDSREKIRVRDLENEGSTLSNLASIQKDETKFNQDLHTVEIGFSPNESVNALIENTLTGNYVAANYVVTGYVLQGAFDIDSILGDPLNAQSTQYSVLKKLSANILTNLDSYDIFDFVRIIKFLDNTIFKMVKDFIPARDSISTGIIIKPHHLDRSKIIIPSAEWERVEYDGLIEVGEYSGSDGGILTDLDTDHSLTFSNKDSFTTKAIDRDTPKYDGELSGSTVDVLGTDLNGTNPFLGKFQPEITYNTTTTTNASTFNTTTPSAGQIVVFYEEVTAESPIDTGSLGDSGVSGPAGGGGGPVGGGGSTPTSYTLTVDFSNMTGGDISSYSPLMTVRIDGDVVSSGLTTYTASVDSGDTVSVTGAWEDTFQSGIQGELFGAIIVSPTGVSPVSGTVTVSGDTTVTFRLKT